MKHILETYPWLQSVARIFELAISIASPIIAFVYFERGYTDHAIFWMVTAIWAGRGAMVRAGVHHYIATVQAHQRHADNAKTEHRRRRYDA